MAVENGAEPAEECRNPPIHLPQAVFRAGTHTRPNRPAPRRRGGTVRFGYSVGLCVTPFENKCMILMFCF